jgi:CDP-diacylglycerol pyrophosphatase
MARAACLALAVIAVVAGSARGQVSRDSLWEIVRDCADRRAPGYCERCTRPAEGACARATTCRTGTEVWALTEQFVAIRDIKMCGCTGAFVHGLALPRAQVTGVESRERPPGIWSFAWQVAAGRIARPEEIALVVNPPALRTQDQLHVHLVRLKSGARERLAARDGVRTDRLDAVWEIAAVLADVRGLSGYGVLVAQARPGEFLVEVTTESPEEAFTLARCASP